MTAAVFSLWIDLLDASGVSWPTHCHRRSRRQKHPHPNNSLGRMGRCQNCQSHEASWFSARRYCCCFGQRSVSKTWSRLVFLTAAQADREATQNGSNPEKRTMCDQLCTQIDQVLGSALIWGHRYVENQAFNCGWCYVMMIDQMENRC